MEDTIYTKGIYTAATSLSEEEALEEARALAHRILGELEL